MARRAAAKRDEAPAGNGATLNWEDLRVALSVARARSLARAAEALGVDPATVSRRVAAAEAALGVVLFVRTSAGVGLTDAGKALLARAGEMEMRVSRLREEVAADGPATGPVRIFCPPWVAARIAAVGAASLRAVHPGVELRLVATRPSCEPGFGEPAIGLWFDRPARVGDFAIRLGAAPFAVYAPAGAPPDCPLTLAHRNEDGAPRVADSLGVAAVDGGCGVDTLAELRRPEGAPFAMTATDALVLREAARAGLGAALLPMCLGEGDPLLENRSPDGPAARRVMLLHANPDIIQSRRVQAVIEMLRGRFDALFGGPDRPATRQVGPALRTVGRRC